MKFNSFQAIADNPIRPNPWIEISKLKQFAEFQLNQANKQPIPNWFGQIKFGNWIVFW